MTMMMMTSSNFCGHFRYLGQHEFAFGFCGSIGIKISRVRKCVAAGDEYSSRSAIFGPLFVGLAFCWPWKEESRRVLK